MTTPHELPTLSLMAPIGRLVGAGTYFEAAALAGLPWIDLVVSSRGRTGQAAHLARLVSATGVGVRAIWLRRAHIGHRRADRAEALAIACGEIVAVTGAGTVVVDRPHPSPRGDAARRLVDAVRRHVPAAARLTLALGPEELHGTRDHLDELRVLRLAAEEWDLDLAFDLDGPIDPRWEAEAAVSKVLPRLSVVRLGSLQSRPPGRSRERQTARVVAYLADQAFSGTIALCAGAPLWRPDRTTLAARSCWDGARAILGRFEVVRRDLFPDVSPQHPERRPSL